MKISSIHNPRASIFMEASRKRGGKSARIFNIKMRNKSKLRGIMLRMQDEIIEAGNNSPEIGSVMHLEARDESEYTGTSIYADGTLVATVQASGMESDEGDLVIILRISDHDDPSGNTEKSKTTIRRTLRIDDVIIWSTNSQHGKWDLKSISESKRLSLLRDPSLNFTIDRSDHVNKIGEALGILTDAIKEIP